MCFVWIWEQTAIISLYSINWLVFITEESVYCAVRTGSWNVTEVKFIVQDGHGAHVAYPPMRHTHLNLHAALIWRRNEKSPETFQRAVEHWSEKYFCFFQSSTDRFTFSSKRAHQGGLFTNKLTCGHALLTGTVVTPRRMWLWLNRAASTAVTLCTYNACAANSHTAAECSPSDPSITNTTFNCPIDTHAEPDVGAPPLSLLASELSRPIDCGCNFYTSKRVGCHMARRDLKWGIKRFMPQLWFLWRKVKAQLWFPPTEASHWRQIMSGLEPSFCLASPCSTVIVPGVYCQSAANQVSTKFWNEIARRRILQQRALHFLLPVPCSGVVA